MERKDEIKEILKHLLGKMEKTIDNNQYTDDMARVIKSSKGVLELAKQIENYIDELGENVA
jgi:hypothetical protein